MQLIVSAVLCLSVAVTLCAGHFSFTRTVTPTNITCTPRRPRACGEAKLLSESSTPLTEGFGPNVCRMTRLYTVQTYSYVETKYCFGANATNCRTYCARTANCTGAMRNFTKIEDDCCDGFAVDDEVSTSTHSFFRRRFSRRSILQQNGCTTMLADSVAVCLLDLTLESFVVEIIEDASDVIPMLGNSNDDARFTIFAVNSSASDNPDAPVNALGHIANRTIGKRNLDGSVFRSLRENVFLHVVKGEETKAFYVNGVEIEDFNACQARNGVVHVVNNPIPQPNVTIAETLKDDARFSVFLQLLDSANITMFLDVANGKSRTVLAPTNQAFEKLPANAVECLLREENAKYLNQLVLIHISSPAEYSVTLAQLSRLYTFNTRYYLFVRTDEDGNILVTNDRIPLEEVDIAANNGVIHAIPDVIVPPEVEFDKICEEDTGADAVLGD